LDHKIRFKRVIPFKTEAERERIDLMQAMAQGIYELL